MKSGKVIDGYGNPIPSIPVIFAQESLLASGVSDATGNYQIDLSPFEFTSNPSTLNLVVNAYPYKPIDSQMIVEEGSNFSDIVLDKQ